VTSFSSSGEPAKRTFLVTGGNTGIGLATATALARGAGRVYIGCRTAATGEAAVTRIKAASGSADVFLLPLDLASLASVRACAESFLARDEPLHVLVNNAGVAGQSGLTADGFEVHFGTNHLGHYALTLLLLPRLTASGPGARVITVASDGHNLPTGIDFAAVRQPTPATSGGGYEYCVSKLGNVLFSQELARRTAGTGVRSYALHPGVVDSDVWRRAPHLAGWASSQQRLTVEEGAATSVYCATSGAVAADSGLFYEKCAIRSASPVATPELAGQLWKHSAEWTGLS
jgi:NAD(P)-dependent dehydrogenase (short-subunit alcohol dehydrogenase family)